MHQITMAVLVLLWLITDIHVATGTCMACAISVSYTHLFSVYSLFPVIK